jgi:hypothetical protein
MISRVLAVACLASACGQVAGKPGIDAAGDGPPDGAVDGRLPDGPVTTAHRGTLAQTSPATFGGAPFCVYTETLKQLQLDLDLLPSGQAVSGRMQALNVEGNDPAQCPNGVIPATIANYTLESAIPNGAAFKLTFRGVAGNNPTVSLVGNLTRTGATYSAMLTFHRIDQPAPLDWTVVTTLSLSPR